MATPPWPGTRRPRVCDHTDAANSVMRSTSVLPVYFLCLNRQLAAGDVRVVAERSGGDKRMITLSYDRRQICTRPKLRDEHEQ